MKGLVGSKLRSEYLRKGGMKFKPLPYIPPHQTHQGAIPRQNHASG